MGNKELIIWHATDGTYYWSLEDPATGTRLCRSPVNYRTKEHCEAEADLFTTHMGLEEA